MQLDRRRITNGLAWAGAALIVAIPTADLIARQFTAAPEPQVAIVQEEPETPDVDLPTDSAERPAQESPESVSTADTGTPSDSGTGDAVDSFIQSGRPLPSYISNGDASSTSARAPASTPAPQRPAAPTQTALAPSQPATPPPSTQNEATRPVITTPRAVTGFPTAVSQRPLIATAPAPIAPAVNPPLIIDRPTPMPGIQVPVVTAQELEDWESGPLSEFLANRGGGARSAPSDYEPGGFWLDEAPSGGREWSYPPAYGEDTYYPFAQ